MQTHIHAPIYYRHVDMCMCSNILQDMRVCIQCCSCLSQEPPVGPPHTLSSRCPHCVGHPGDGPASHLPGPQVPQTLGVPVPCSHSSQPPSFSSTGSWDRSQTDMWLLGQVPVLGAGPRLRSGPVLLSKQPQHPPHTPLTPSEIKLVIPCLGFEMIPVIKQIIMLTSFASSNASVRPRRREIKSVRQTKPHKPGLNCRSFY